MNHGLRNHAHVPHAIQVFVRDLGARDRNPEDRREAEGRIYFTCPMLNPRSVPTRKFSFV
jgi:hypothetical protein